MAGHIYEFDARLGGSYQMALAYRGDHPNANKTSDDTDVVKGRFAELVTNDRVVQIVTFQSNNPSFAGDMRMTWSLSLAVGGTDVSVIVTLPPI